MRSNQWDDNVAAKWEADWDDNWDEDPRLKSPLQRFIDWIGLSSVGSSNEYDDEFDSASSSLSGWLQLYWQRSLAVLFFLIGLILILRLAVLM